MFQTRTATEHTDAFSNKNIVGKTAIQEHCGEYTLGVNTAPPDPLGRAAESRSAAAAAVCR